MALAAAGLAAVGVALAADASGVLTAAERSTQDARFDLRGARTPPRDVVLVQIDARTFRELRRRYPFPRSVHAEMVRRLTAAGARAIAYDVQFTEPTSPKEDNALIQAVAHAPHVVLSTTEVAPGGRVSVFGGNDVLRGIGARAGNTAVDPDGDGVLRHMDYALDGLPTFPVAVASAVTGHPVSHDGFGSDGTAWIDFAGPPGTLRSYSFSQVLQGRVPPGAFRGRIVVVGAGAPSLGDVHATSTTRSDEEMSGPEVNANEIETVLRGVPLRDTPGWLGVVLVIALGLVAPLAAIRLSSGRVLAVALGAGAAFAALVWVAFQSGRVVPVAAPALALALGGLAALAVGGFYAAVARERARTIFARFVAEPVVDEVLAHSVVDLRLGGVRVDATLMFCDLRGSTTLLEQMEPERGIEVLNVFLSAMADAVLAQGGTLLGYRGDGLLAIFGAPLPQPDQADRALRAGLDMAGPRLTACNRWLHEQSPGIELRMGVGIHSGEVMAGNVGSEARMEYTAIGDPVNVAARVEGLTKEMGHAVLVTGATRERLSTSDGLLVRVGRREVRGRAEEVELWAPAIEP